MSVGLRDAHVVARLAGGHVDVARGEARRDRKPEHIIGTQETRPGPSGWSPTGMGHKGKPECSIEPRSGVGPAHSTDDAAEGNEARRGKGPA